MVTDHTELVRATREGDLDAFGQLVERFQDVAVGYAWGQLGDLADAVDVAQDAFIDVLRKIETLRDPAAFPGWLRTIVATHCARVHRHRRRAQPPIPPPVEAPLEHGLVEGERAERVRRLVGELPPAERVVVAMHHLGGCSYAEIAALLDISEGAARTRAHRARQRLRQSWEEHGAMGIEDAIGTHRPSRDARFATSTLLFAAIAREDLQTARRLVEADPSLVEVEEDWDDETARTAGLLPARDASPLVRAVGRGNRDLVELLIRHGADVNRTCACAGGESPLWAATVQGDEGLVRVLLERGADPGRGAFRGTTPLHIAVMRGYRSIARMLLDAGADPAATDDHGRIPADWAVTDDDTPRTGDLTAPTPRDVDEEPRSPDLLLESGIKAINLFAPLRRGSVSRWVAPAGTGSLVVLTELMHNLSRLEGLVFDLIGFEHRALTAAELRHALAELDPAAAVDIELADAERSAPERRRRFIDAVTRISLTGRGHRSGVVIVAAHPAHVADVEAELPRLLDASEAVLLLDPDGDAADGTQLPPDASTITLDPLLARAQLFPAVDPERTVGSCPDGEHADAADEIRRLLARYRLVDPERTLRPPPDDEPWMATARAVHRFLTQPFHTTEPFTGQPGAALSISDTIDLVSRILGGDDVAADVGEHTLARAT